VLASITIDLRYHDGRRLNAVSQRRLAVQEQRLGFNPHGVSVG